MSVYNSKKMDYGYNQKTTILERQQLEGEQKVIWKILKRLMKEKSKNFKLMKYKRQKHSKGSV